jgi:hypothetical protein
MRFRFPVRRLTPADLPGVPWEPAFGPRLARSQVKLGTHNTRCLRSSEPDLGAPLLLHTRRNPDGVNWKVTCIKMAHEYLLRAFLTFSLLLLVNIGWYLAGPLIQNWLSAPGLVLTTPRQAIAAVAEVDSLAAQLRTTEAWTVLDNDCRRRTDGRAALTFAPGVVSRRNHEELAADRHQR